MLVGALIGYGIFYLLYEAMQPSIDYNMRKLRGDPNALRSRHDMIYENLMDAQPTGLGLFSLGKTMTSEQTKWLDQERQFLCLLSTEPCAPFPSSWEERFEETIKNLFVKLITGSKSQKGIMGDIKHNLKKDPTANVKFSVVKTVKHGLADLGNELLNDDNEQVNYLSTQWDRCPETGRKIGRVEGRSIQRSHTIIKRMVELMRRGPISSFEITLSTLDEILEEYRKFARKGSLKFLLASVPFKNRVNILYARLDQCFSVMPLWFLQVMNITLNSLHIMKGTKLPYKLSLFNKPLVYGLFEDRALKMVDDYTMGKIPEDDGGKMPGLERHADETGWFWSFMLKSLMASNVSRDCRGEIRRKNQDTLRKMGIQHSSLDGLSSNNKILGSIAGAVQKTTGNGSKWALELSDILTNRATVRKANGYLEKFPKGKTAEECKTS